MTQNLAGSSRFTKLVCLGDDGSESAPAGVPYGPVPGNRSQRIHAALEAAAQACRPVAPAAPAAPPLPELVIYAPGFHQPWHRLGPAACFRFRSGDCASLLGLRRRRRPHHRSTPCDCRTAFRPIDADEGIGRRVVWVPNRRRVGGIAAVAQHGFHRGQHDNADGNLRCPASTAVSWVICAAASRR
jgi:hypothetical protein